MSTNTATQAASTSTASVTETTDQSVATTTETTATAAPAATASTAKKQKLTDRIVSVLRGLEDGQLLTIDGIYKALSEQAPVKKETLQATLSQLKKANRVVKVDTQKRQPGYKAAK